MKEDQFLQTIHFNALVKDELATMPVAIVLDLSEEDKIRLENCQEISLVYEGRVVGEMGGLEFYRHRKEERVARQFGTTSPKHPYIKVPFYYVNWSVN